jgi:hypothetical protein
MKAMIFLVTLHSWLMSTLAFTSSRLILNTLKFGDHPDAVSGMRETMSGEDDRADIICPMTTNIDLELDEFTQHRAGSGFGPQKPTNL